MRPTFRFALPRRDWRTRHDFLQTIARFSNETGDNLESPLRQTFRHFREMSQTKGHPAPTLAGHGVILLREKLGPQKIEVVALAPSSDDVLRAMDGFAGLFVPPNLHASGLSPLGPNRSSIVLYVEFAGEAFLLGGDLEHVAGRNSGWNAVESSVLLTTSAAMFKVLHHGSAGAHSPDIWQNKIEPDAIAVITCVYRKCRPVKWVSESRKLTG
jgi:hypothetical protein